MERQSLDLTQCETTLGLAVGPGRTLGHGAPHSGRRRHHLGSWSPTRVYNTHYNILALLGRLLHSRAKGRVPPGETTPKDGERVAMRRAPLPFLGPPRIVSLLARSTIPVNGIGLGAIARERRRFQAMPTLGKQDAAKWVCCVLCREDHDRNRIGRPEHG